MSFGRGMSVPDKTIPPRSNPNTIDIQEGLLGNANWHELQSICGGFLTGNGVFQNTNSLCPLTLEKPILPQNKPNSREIQGAQLAEANLLEVPTISGRIPLSRLIQNKDSWEPVTPNKTVPSRHNVNPMETQVSQLGKSTWVELVEMYTGLLKYPINNYGVQSSDPSGQPGEHAEQYQGYNRYESSIVPLDYNPGRGNCPISELSGMVHAQSIASVSGGLGESIHLAGRPTHPGFHTPIGSNCQESETTTMHTLLHQRMSNYVSSQSHNDGFPVPFQPIYNLNSPTRSEADAVSETNSSQFGTTSHIPNHQYSVMPNFSLERSQEKNKLKNLALSTSETIEKCLDEPLQNPVDSLSAEITTKEKGDSDNGRDQGIDLNKTPQQKTPKRRKHRPKVIIEGKPKRGRKPANNDKNAAIENPTRRRKYVRKKGLTATAAADGSILNVVSTPPSAKPKADVSTEVSFPAAAVQILTRKKRKYIRKKGLSPVTQKADVHNEVSISPVGPVANSCRRMLNFDAETVTRDECQNSVGCSHAGIYEASNNAFNLNLNPQDTISCTKINGIPGATASQLGKQNEYIKANQQAGTKSDLNCLTDPMVAYPTSLQAVSSATPAKMKDHNLNTIATSFKMISADPCQNSMTVSYCQMHRQFHLEKINQFALEEYVINRNSDNMGQPALQNAQLVAENMANIDGKRGLKRDHSHASERIHHQTENLMSSSTLSQMILQPGVPKNDKFETASLGTYKRSKNENKCHTTIYSQFPSVTAVIDCLKQAESKGKDKSCGCQLTPRSHVTLNRNAERESTAEQNSGFNGTSALCCISPIAARHNYQNQVSTEAQTNREKVAHQSQGSTQVHWLNSRTGIIDWNKLNPTPSKIASPANFVQGIEACQAYVFAEKHMKVSQQSSGAEKTGYKHALNDYQQSPSKTKVGADSLRKKKVADLIDEITYRLKVLNINSQDDENALVPYEGKKRKPRPKVDLDPETQRIWRLLMGKEGSEDMEATDKEKEKKWGEERNVFRGRADSFIARMHLVQGDRRFSKWKGSVVDSVIGVFLTQNVSDHLSSSAFMSLAAKFSIGSKTNQWCYRHETSILVEEPDIQTPEPDSIIIGGGTTERHIFQQSTVTCSRSSKHSTKSLACGPRTVLAYEHSRREEEEIISSQNSETSEEIRSSSGSNSEAEDRTKPNNNDSPVSHQSQAPSPKYPSPMHKETMLSLFYSQLNGSLLFNGQQQSENPKFNMQSQGFDRFNYQSSSAFTFPTNSNSFHTQESINQSRNLKLNMTPDAVLDVGYCGVLGKESISSLPSTCSRVTKARGADLMNNGVGPTAEGIRKLLAKQNEVPKIEDPTLGPYKILGKHPVPPNGDLQPGSNNPNNQLSANSYKQARFNASQMGNTSITEKPTVSKPAVRRKTGAKQQVADYQNFTRQCLDIEETTFVEKHSCLETKAASANANEQHSQSLNGMVTTTSKARKGKAKAEKGKPFDWDSLRKQVQRNGEIKERSKETMDSMDYEAVRCADVKEISKTIKKRGMNNILAGRIKDFLNRLVDEHGSIDLEWLRDVPPDKAKDYLLSIPGLGLKSVECVRLLTLHHLAFPVDTNVGRIAVRLGWVPLQPLPESLQLHLLELYPVLESIQKYLWPRLCKLDQRTLYELHYQMITFGKVFCTKSKPNCNSCPMRGECRHFASAFASARLALTGPEDRSIVSSSATTTAEEHTAFIVKPMPLPSAERNSIEEVRFSGSNCEPIVEEPMTPEPERSEITETDIEDACYEDSDEIPTIKLNIEEFTINLHNYMQENTELQEGDMSKALVALNQEAASIPTPKLKNVRHLRTEHHVYELPDSHPLLEMLDKREPDDPSPYLLAIWTPGEMADLIQPPERTCGSGSQESCSICNDHTCFSCNSIREANSQTVRGTLLIPCRTAMRGSFPLNGTYFQVNEVFADHDSSLKPIDVPRAWLWNLPRRTVYFGTSVSTIFKGMPTEEIQYCFWRGFVCVRGFDRKKRAPRPLMARLHFPASKLTRTKK